MTASKLTPLQTAFLVAFFRQDDFFLTGGAALAGFHLGNRGNHDLDLFTLQDILEEGVAEAYAIAEGLGGTIERIQTSPDFRHLLMRRNEEAVVLGLVRDRAPQLVSDKSVVDGIRIDFPEEILAHKLCTLLSRAEVRDLVDVRALEAAGYRIEDAIAAAAQKDAGLTPAQLAGVLSQIRLGEDLIPPGGILRAELQHYVDDLLRRLTKLAYPPGA